MTSERQDKILKGFIIWAAATATVTLLLAAVALPFILSGTSSSQAVERANQLASCRSQIRSQTVDYAAGQLDVASAANDALIVDVLEGIIAGNPELIRKASQEAPAIRTQIREARTLVEESALTLDKAIQLSIDDPEMFLAQCEERR